MKLNIKLPLKKIMTYSYLVLLLFSLVTIASVTLFLYSNFYKTIAQSEELIYLKQQVAIETINVKKFENILEKISKKKEIDLSKDVNNPFD